MAARNFRGPPQPQAALAPRASPGVAAGSYTTPWDASLVYPPGRHVHGLGELVLTHAHRLEKILAQDFTGID